MGIHVSPISILFPPTAENCFALLGSPLKPPAWFATTEKSITPSSAIQNLKRQTHYPGLVPTPLVQIPFKQIQLQISKELGGCPSPTASWLANSSGWHHALLVERLLSDFTLKSRDNATSKAAHTFSGERQGHGRSFIFATTELEAQTNATATFSLPVKPHDPGKVAHPLEQRWQPSNRTSASDFRLARSSNLDQLRAKDPDLAKTDLLGKMVAAVLLETIAADCRDISPWGLPLRDQSMFMAGVEPAASDCETDNFWEHPNLESV